MSDIEYLSTNLIQRLQCAEKSIKFLQQEHASTLADLHKELAKWQQKYSDLTTQLTFNNPADNNKLQEIIKQLKNDLYQSRNKIENLNKILEEKEKIVNDYKNRLKLSEQKYALELHKQHDKQQNLKYEIKQRSTSITHLTKQLFHEKQQQPNVCNHICLGHIILPNKPRRFKNLDEQRQQQQYLSSDSRSSKRSASVNNRISTEQNRTKVLSLGRRPSRLQPLVSNNNEQLVSKSHRQLLNNHIDSNKIVSSQSTVKFSTILPPINNKKMPLKATLSCESEA
ncbi:unnamed protein product [Adineta steineri]|nr:unnamed protein product [Adineta steineri]